MNRFKKPRFEHDCNACVYLGQFKKFDCWFCPPHKSDIGGGSLIMRYSSEPSEYASYDMSTAVRIAISPTGNNVRATETFEALMACMRAVNDSELVRTRYSQNKRKVRDYRQVREGFPS